MTGWGTPVTGPPPRAQRYRELVERIRLEVVGVLPADATVLVVSKGDEELLRLGCRAWHFPRDEKGGYAGHHPADGAAAVAHLEALRAAGAGYLLLPATALWWLDHYKELHDHLRGRCRLVLQRDDTCRLWKLPEQRAEPAPEDRAAREAAYRHVLAQVRELTAALLPDDATVLVASRGDEELLRLGCRAWHFPRDERGGYAGYHPADGAAAVAHLEALRAAGAGYLLLPATALWWLDHYKELHDHLRGRCRLVTDQEHVCRIYALPAAEGDVRDLPGSGIL